MLFKLLEGEPLVYNGILWIVKGYQHPPGKIIAIPRYDLVNKRKSIPVSRYVENMNYWDCLKIEVTMLDRGKTYPYKPCLNPSVEYIISFMREYMGFKDYLVTGSTLIGGGRDIDIIIYGFKQEYLDSIKELIKCKIVNRSLDLLFHEYFLKHIRDTNLETYIHIKKNTLLHILYRGVHINFKFLRYSHGYNYCVDPVYYRRFFYGEIKIIEPIDKYVIPSRYRVLYNDEEYVLESYREIYAELPIGKYYVEGFLESRRDNTYIIPDHGRLIWIGKE